MELEDSIPNSQGALLWLRIRTGGEFSAFWLRTKCNICSYQL
jgi:hypothetical protein